MHANTHKLHTHMHAHTLLSVLGRLMGTETLCAKYLETRLGLGVASQQLSAFSQIHCHQVSRNFLLWSPRYPCVLQHPCPSSERTTLTLGPSFSLLPAPPELLPLTYIWTLPPLPMEQFPSASSTCACGWPTVPSDQTLGGHATQVFKVLSPSDKTDWGRLEQGILNVEI